MGDVIQGAQATLRIGGKTIGRLRGLQTTEEPAQPVVELPRDGAHGAFELRSNNSEKFQRWLRSVLDQVEDVWWLHATGDFSAHTREVAMTGHPGGRWGDVKPLEGPEDPLAWVERIGFYCEGRR